MTMDHSRTVEAFLKSAAKKRKFAVVVAETAPSFTGRTLARSLSSAGSTSSSDPSPSIPTLLIPDSSIFALMSRCSKVVIGCHAVLADGSLLARSGSLGLCRSAKAHLVPVVVVCGMYKFSPVYSLGAGGGTGKGGFGARAGTDLASSDLKSPEEVLREEEVLGWQDAGDGKGQVEVLNPYYDRVPSELVSLFITNLCACAFNLSSVSLADVSRAAQRRAPVVAHLQTLDGPVRLKHRPVLHLHHVHLKASWSMRYQCMGKSERQQSHRKTRLMGASFQRRPSWVRIPGPSLGEAGPKLRRRDLEVLRVGVHAHGSPESGRCHMRRNALEPELSPRDGLVYADFGRREASAEQDGEDDPFVRLAEEMIDGLDARRTVRIRQGEPRGAAIR